jgi:hypothetical protein
MPAKIVFDDRGQKPAPTEEKAMPFPYNQGARLVEAIHELPLLQLFS